MARIRAPERDKAKDIYIEHKGNITNREIANMINEDEKKIAVWKKRDNWDNEESVVQQKSSTNKKSTKEQQKDAIYIEAKKIIENGTLTDKQKDFCFYYVKYRNQVKAYMKAYQCSYTNACSHAYETWNNVEVKKEIDKQLQEIRENLKIDIQDLIKINMDIVFADMKDYTEWGKKPIPIVLEDGSTIEVEGNYVDFKDSNEVDGTLISEVKKGKDGVSIKLLDKAKAIEFLNKHLEDVDELTRKKLELENKRLQNEKIAKEIKGNSDMNKEPVRIVDDI